MTKWDYIQIDKISKTLDDLDTKAHENHVDFYYRFHGKTIKETDTWRSIVTRERENRQRIERIGIDTEKEPLLFDFVCYKDDPLLSKRFQLDDKKLNVISMFRESFREEIINKGITEGDIETWLRELTTKKK